MHVWIIEATEPLPFIDTNYRDFRCGILAQELVARGHAVIWWTSTFDHFTKRHRFSPRVIEVLPGLQIIFLYGPGYGRNNSPKRFLHHRVVARNFFQEAAACNKPDIVFCCLPTLELAEQAVIYGQRNGVPVLIDVRDLWPDHYLTLVPQRLRSLFRLVIFSEFHRARRLLKAATGITAISNTFLDWALKHAGRTRRQTDGVFPIGYPCVLSSLETQIAAKREELVSLYKLRPEDLIVTFVGTFSLSFDLETVIEAARILDQAEHDDIKFVFVGDGGNSPQLRARARGLGNAIFTGWFDQVSILAMLSLSSVGLAPYRNDASMSLPNKPFEYMAAGLPILSSLRGELATLIHEEQIGLQYQAGNVASLIEKIRWLAANPDARREMGMRARKLFEERFSAEVIYPRLVRHLEGVARRE